MSRPPMIRQAKLLRCQMALLRFIAGYAETHNGLMPTFREMADGTALGSTSKVSRMLDLLEKRGMVRRLRRRQCAIEILRYPSLPRGTDGVARYFVSVGSKNFHGGSNA